LNNGFQLVSSFVVFGLIYFSITASVLSLGGIAVFLFAMFRLAPKINSLNNMAYHIDGHLPHVARTRETLQGLEREQETDRSETTRPITEPVTTLSFEDVSFTYADGTAALHDVSFHATSGEFVALVGPSGAGKSTIVSLLSRLREPGSGTIRANGTDIRTYELNSWRSRVAVVQQNPYLFNETLRFNLTLGRSYGRSELDRVCEIARVTEFLDDLPDGYETTLGDEGVRLSGGQRQRVAIARALLRDASVLVLDEATSDLDTALEADIHAAIESLDRDMITIAIAHRLSTIVDSDRIYVVEEGRIAERGDHGALLGKDGTYAELSQAQSGSQ
jgi:subfamily B ATP-binding cassette protein MsbA